jgi:hypothetical protein
MRTATRCAGNGQVRTEQVGFERLAELQEEILWLCEAAHVPAIWATQVLDTLARTGVPSRAEVTKRSLFRKLKVSTFAELDAR